MAGRHGNKGVISRILPKEDMPFYQMELNKYFLNPWYTISYEHRSGTRSSLGLAAKALGWYVATSVFDGAKESDIRKLLVQAGYPEDGKQTLYDGRTGETFAIQ